MWDAHAGFIDGAEAGRTGQREDLAVCARLGVEHVHLPFLDAPYRASESDLDALDDALRDVLARTTVVLAPAGVGEDPDHVTVRERTRRCLRTG